jgi:hypothetical protein
MRLVLKRYKPGPGPPAARTQAPFSHLTRDFGSTRTKARGYGQFCYPGVEVPVLLAFSEIAIVRSDAVCQIFFRIDLPSKSRQLFDAYRSADANAVARSGIAGEFFRPSPA